MSSDSKSKSKSERTAGVEPAMPEWRSGVSPPTLRPLRMLPLFKIHRSRHRPLRVAMAFAFEPNTTVQKPETKKATEVSLGGSFPGGCRRGLRERSPPCAIFDTSGGGAIALTQKGPCPSGRPGRAHARYEMA